MLRSFFLSIFSGLFLMSANAMAADPENTLILDLKDGKVTIELFPDKAPKHVDRVKELVRQGFYDGIVWHRVIDGFMAQTGDPTGTGTGGSGKNLKAEFNDTKHERGTVSMARASDPDSADSQWFICFEAAPHLDGQYTAWGKVTEGMEIVDKIKRGAPDTGLVTNPDKIIRIQVAADIKPEGAAAPAATGTEAKTEEKPAAEKPAMESSEKPAAESEVKKEEPAKEEMPAQ